MQESLRTILDIQELDMKMLRLVRVRKERSREVEQIGELRRDLHTQLGEKEKEIEELNKTIQAMESKIQETVAKIKKLESQQSSIKKVDEFNAITQESTALEREKIALEHKTSDLVDKRVAEEEMLEKIRESLKTSEASSIALENEIKTSIQMINSEGQGLKQQREALVSEADAETLRIYERLLRNKKDRVVVAIENRACSGCHIALTAQHENVVRKGKNLVFCEHCSRIHYWPDTEVTEGVAGATPTRRRRRRAATA
jgi:uncharacterized protein